MSEAPSIGSVRLYDAARPDLPAGTYRITSSLDITNQRAGGEALATAPEHVAHVQVRGPRFALQAGEIASRHPPQRSHGAFGDRLPHVALGRRTLPWERRISSDSPAPWLALLLVRPDEASFASGKLSSLLPADVVARLNAIAPEDPELTVVRMNDSSLLRAILPSREEVELLCHVRQVNLADTALAEGDDDGSFAVVTSNRLPISDGETEYVACLVSLEARSDVWAAGAGTAPPLIVLASWSFVSTGQGGTFEHLANHLDVGGFGVAAQGSDALVDSQGLLPLSLQRRSGDQEPAFYRGPLCGLALDLDAPPRAGDLSQIAAYELGRLLGAADARFLRELAAWHSADERGLRAAYLSSELRAELLRASRAHSIDAQRTAASSIQEIVAERVATLAASAATRSRIPLAAARAAALATRPKAEKRGRRR